jgi:cytochrome b involved in lipid metabolism
MATEVVNLRITTSEVLDKYCISLDEVSNHDSLDDCWIILYDRVYDVTNFLSSVSYVQKNISINFLWLTFHKLIL